MKLHPFHASHFTVHVSRRRQAGSAVIVVLALVVIIMIYVAGNLRTLNSLGRELGLVERQQVQRLQKAGRATNTPPAEIIATNVMASLPAN